MRVPSPLVFDGALDEPFYRDVASFVRFLLNEVAKGCHVAIERLIERAVEHERRWDAHGSKGDVALPVARNHGRRYGNRRTLNRRITTLCERRDDSDEK